MPGWCLTKQSHFYAQCCIVRSTLLISGSHCARSPHAGGCKAACCVGYSFRCCCVCFSLISKPFREPMTKLAFSPSALPSRQVQFWLLGPPPLVHLIIPLFNWSPFSPSARHSFGHCLKTKPIAFCSESFVFVLGTPSSSFIEPRLNLITIMQFEAASFKRLWRLLSFCAGVRPPSMEVLTR